MTERGAGLTVRDVTVRAVVVPLRRPLATKVGDFSRWPLLLIDVATEQGVVGRGYLAPYLVRAATALRTVLADLGAGLRGRPVSPGAAYAEARGWLGLAGYQGLALAAVACWTSRCGMRWPRPPACRWPGCWAARWPRSPRTTATAWA